MKPKSLLKRVLQFAREELERRARPEDLPYDSTPPRAQHALDEGYTGGMQPARDDVEPSLHGLEVLRPHDGGALKLRWALRDEDVSRAGVMLNGNPVLCLRVVSFSKTRDDVLREVQDRPGIELEGQCEIHEPAQRAVVSLGLRSGERFVSIAHHVL
jgi:type II secretory pathway predicted ATPase ExeA